MKEVWDIGEKEASWQLYEMKWYIRQRKCNVKTSDWFAYQCNFHLRLLILSARNRFFFFLFFFGGLLLLLFSIVFIPHFSFLPLFSLPRFVSVPICFSRADRCILPCTSLKNYLCCSSLCSITPTSIVNIAIMRTFRVSVLCQRSKMERHASCHPRLVQTARRPLATSREGRRADWQVIHFNQNACSLPVLAEALPFPRGQREKRRRCVERKDNSGWEPICLNTARIGHWRCTKQDVTSRTQFFSSMDSKNTID